MISYYGVRHFSPACAFYVTEFLDRVQPQLVLIEGPSDLNHLIEPLCGGRTRLPAAILAYTDEPPVRTVHYPFAEFSPEYRAMKWAIENRIPVRFCDLPTSYCLVADVEREFAGTESVYEKIEEISGMDNETLWEYNFEQNTDYDDFIAAVEEYGKSIREFSENDSMNQLREAFMRRTISKSMTNGIENIAVITGAFHTHGLKDVPYTEQDATITENLPSVSCKSTLMPYSYYRLSSHSGYGAGSKAPAYYEILWKNRKKGELVRSSAEYLSKIATYQRRHGYYSSSAEIIEALRLANTLAMLNGGKMPSMNDLRDAAVTCIGHGSFGEISLACADVEIGTKIGYLPEGSVSTALRSDFVRNLKELNLERFVKLSIDTLELDLREKLNVKSEKSAFLDLNRSFFMHRTSVLGINFGTKLPQNQDNATWKETWQLQWEPTTEIHIVEASLNGNTVEEAAKFILNEKIIKSSTLSETCKILSDAFMCGFSDIVSTLSNEIRRLAVDCTSAVDNGKAINMLSEIIRFGNIRHIDSEPLIPLVQQLYLRFCLSLFVSAVCDKAAANELVPAISYVNDACLSHDFIDDGRFIDTLTELSESDTVNPYISGFACAILSERGKIDSEHLSTLIGRHLSTGTSPQDGASWFEGLAKKNRRSLISRLGIWEKLCTFISELDKDGFKSALVCLRRTFSEFSPSEKSDIAENIGEILGVSVESASEFINSVMTDDEQNALDELDDFDFGDI